MKKDPSRIKKLFVRFLAEKIKDVSTFDGPMAVYEWLVREWQKPLKGEALRQAYLAAWAFSIDKGLVKL